MNKKMDSGKKPEPPVKRPQSVSHSKEPRGFKAWLIRIINRAIKRLSKFR